MNLIKVRESYNIRKPASSYVNKTKYYNKSISRTGALQIFTILSL